MLMLPFTFKIILVTKLLPKISTKTQVLCHLLYFSSRTTMLVQHIQTACNAFKLAESFPLDLCKWRNLTSIQTVSTFVGYE